MIRRILSIVWLAVARIRYYLYSKEILKSYNSGIKIISVGNITVGGAGKTPFVAWLLKRLVPKGLKVAVIEKGYKSELAKKECVMAQKPAKADTSRWGDEPRMLWELCPDGTRFCVCSDKTKAVMEIEKNWPDTQLIIIDDGFQHLRLKRDIDIVLMEAGRGFSEKLLPMGRLREPYSALKRADILIFTKSESSNDTQRQELLSKALQINPGIRVFFAGTDFISSKDIRDKKIFPVSSIYDPEYFHLKLRQAGAVFKRYMAFSDHYNFDKKTVRMFLEKAREEGAQSVAITAKDWVKIRPLLDSTGNFASAGSDTSSMDFIECNYEHRIDKEKEFLNCCI